MIQVKNVTRHFGSKVALSKTSLSIAKGEWVVIQGPSGCGKTTLLRCIAGLEPVDSGEIIIDNTLVSNATTLRPPQERNCAMVFQNLALWPHMTVSQHLKFVQPSSLSRSERAEYRKQILTQVQMSAHSNKYPHELSGGECQRLALARSLASKSRIILLDEPTSNLDASLKTEMLQLVLEIQKKKSLTIVMASHEDLDMKELPIRVEKIPSETLFN